MYRQRRVLDEFKLDSYGFVYDKLTGELHEAWINPGREDEYQIEVDSVPDSVLYEAVREAELLAKEYER